MKKTNFSDFNSDSTEVAPPETAQKKSKAEVEAESTGSIHNSKTLEVQEAEKVVERAVTPDCSSDKKEASDTTDEVFTSLDGASIEPEAASVGSEAASVIIEEASVAPEESPAKPEEASIALEEVLAEPEACVAPAEFSKVPEQAPAVATREEEVLAPSNSPQLPEGPAQASEVPMAPIADSSAAADEAIDETSMLMDESIISVAESPPAAAARRDSTFSPVVDTSIHDSRPTIDEHIFSPMAVALRTSTPLVKKAIFASAGGTPKREERKRQAPVMSSLAKSFTPFAEASKPNLMERSILKSSRRKRSMSVADSESFMQKHVMFISPKVMEIDEIDEKMLASFREEKENSMMKLAASSGRRRRSMSTGTASVPKVVRSKVPNFKAIHEQQFKKMESIADHVQRKTERAKKLNTPVQEEKTKPKIATPKKLATPQEEPSKENKTHQASKIPTMNARKPLVKAQTTENLVPGGTRKLKRSMSANNDEPVKKKQQLVAGRPVTPKKIAVVSGLQRAVSESTKSTWKPPVITVASFLGPKWDVPSTSQSVAQGNKDKLDERRDRNKNLYKTNQVQSSVTGARQKNSELLKGVRLNRRFELQMKHRHDHDS